MPVTAFAFLIGAAAISGLPPLNGFGSEWLTYQGLLGAGAAIPLSPVARSAALLAVGALGLTAALAVACFVKATGVGFLALPRSAGRQPRARRAAGWAPRWSASPWPASASAWPRDPWPRASPGSPAAWSGSRPARPPARRRSRDRWWGRASAAPCMRPPGSASSCWRWRRSRGSWASGRRPARRAPTWTCGIVPEPAFEYTATSFAKLIRLYFGPILRPAREVTVELHPGTPFPRAVRYRGEARHLIDERLYEPLHRAAVGAAQAARRLQTGAFSSTSPTP